MGKKCIDNIRDCVKQAFLKGCERGNEFDKMRFAIPSELKRLGYEPSEIKDMLIEWNKRCERPLSLSERDIQLFGYVDWVFKKNPHPGCKALEDYCIGKENCQFHLKTTFQNREITKELPFNLEELDKFLNERFKPNGYVMMLIVKVLRYVQQEKATGEVIFIGYRKIASIIRDRYGHDIDLMTVYRRMQQLIEEGVIKQEIKGKKGTFSRLANGYKFLAWKSPTITHINLYV